MAKRRRSGRKYSGIGKVRRKKYIEEFLERDGWECHLCGQPLDPTIKDPRNPELVTIDHRKPRCEGGRTTSENLALAHKWCNNRRGNKKIGLESLDQTC